MNIRLLCLLWAVTVSGCGEDADDIATFGGEMTGAFSAPLSGGATYGILRTGGVTTFTILLGDGGAADLTLRYDEDERPEEGTYPIRSPDDSRTGIFRGTVDHVADGVLNRFDIQDGTVTIERSIDGDLDGTLDLRAVRTSPCCDPSPVEVTITGGFDAAPVDTGT
jgi:hypothetical protein